VNTLKSAAMIVVLLGVLYGVYVSLNKPQFPASVPEAASDLAPPLVEFGPAQAGSPALGIPAPTLARGQADEPASAVPGRPSSPPLLGPDLDRGTLPPPTTAPPLDPTAGAPGDLKRSAYEAPAAASQAEIAPATAETPAPGTSAGSGLSAAEAALTPAKSTSDTTAADSAPAGESPTLVAWKLQRDWQTAEQLVADGKFKAALATLSPYYVQAGLAAEQRTALIAWLDALAGKVIYSPEHFLAAPHQVRRDETLFTIADRYDVPWRLLANINGRAVSDPMVLVPGTELKVVPGKFRADVNLASGELTLFLNELYAGRFPFTVGDQPPPPGEYKVVDKQQQRTYYGLDSRVIPANDPSNPYGGWWISLGGEVAIHGSPASAATQTLGCVSLSPQDAQDVYGILSLGSSVTIRR
jgi:hypothetical protein